MQKTLCEIKMASEIRAKLLSHHEQMLLTNKFLQVCGGDKTPYLTRNNFHEFMKTNNSEYFNERIFDMIQKTIPDKVSCADLIHFVETFSTNDCGTKISFIFQLFDINNDGMLTKSELLIMMKASMLANGLVFDEIQLDLLATTLIEEVTDPSVPNPEMCGLNKRQFTTLVKSNENLFQSLSNIIENILLPTEDERDHSKNSSWINCVISRTTCSTFLKILNNRKCLFLWTMVFSLLNIALVSWRYFEFTTDPSSRNESIYLAIARSAGFALDFNCSFVIIPMLRHALTRLRNTRFGKYFPIDDHRLFHKMVGIFVYIFGGVHAVAHLLHVGLVVIPNDSRNPMNLTFLEYVLEPFANLGFGLVHGCAYLSGFILVISLTILGIGVLPYFRNNGCFHVFYWSHFMSYWIFFTVMIIHSRSFWMYFVGVAAMFIVEQVYGLWSGSSTVATSCFLLPSRVINLVIKRPDGFMFSPGDYAFLKIPKISKYEWHPFTISSSPEHGNRFMPPSDDADKK